MMKKPVGVYIIAVLMLIDSAIGIIGGLRGLGVPLPVLGKLTLNPGTPIFLPVGILTSTMLVLSIVLFVFAIGLFLFKPWARGGAISVAVIMLFVDLFFVLFGGFGLGILGAIGGLVGAVINLLIVVYLSRRNVKAAFNA
jgi:hypothetical protein